MTEPVVKVFIMEIHLRGGDEGRSTAPNFVNESRDIVSAHSKVPARNQTSGGGLETVTKPSEETSMWRSVPRTRDEIQKGSTVITVHRRARKLHENIIFSLGGLDLVFLIFLDFARSELLC